MRIDLSGVWIWTSIYQYSLFRFFTIFYFFAVVSWFVINIFFCFVSLQTFPTLEGNSLPKCDSRFFNEMKEEKNIFKAVLTLLGEFGVEFCFLLQRPI